MLRKGFSIMELSIVIIIIGIAVLFMKKIMLPSNEILKEEVIERRYGEVKKYIYNDAAINKVKISNTKNRYYDNKINDLVYYTSYTGTDNLCDYANNNTLKIKIIEGGVTIMDTTCAAILYPAEYADDIKIEGNVYTFDNATTFPLFMSHQQIFARGYCRRTVIGPDVFPDIKVNSTAEFTLYNSEQIQVYWCVETDMPTAYDGIRLNGNNIISTTGALRCLDDNSGRYVRGKEAVLRFSNIPDIQLYRFKVYAASYIDEKGRLQGVQDIRTYGITVK